MIRCTVTESALNKRNKCIKYRGRQHFETLGQGRRMCSVSEGWSGTGHLFIAVVKPVLVTCL